MDNIAHLPLSQPYKSKPRKISQSQILKVTLSLLTLSYVACFVMGVLVGEVFRYI